jgi:hypothetical protein
MSTPSYPLSLPTPNFSSSIFEIARKTGYTESTFTGKQQVHEYPYALWKATLTLPPLRRADWNNWSVFILQLRGRRGTFLLGDPDNTVTQGTATGTILTNGATNAGATQVSLNGFSNTGTIKKGDYIQLGANGSNTLHLVTADATASGGAMTVHFEPATRSAIANDTSVVFGNTAKGIFRMDGDLYGWEANAVSTYGFSFSCTQAF